jgi:hypothetical protein
MPKPEQVKSIQQNFLLQGVFYVGMFILASTLGISVSHMICSLGLLLTLQIRNLI